MDRTTPWGLQMLGGAAQVLAGGALTSTCETGIGCAAAVWVAGTGLDNSRAGSATLMTGNPTPTIGEQVLQGFGMSPGAAGLVYGITQLAPAAGEAYAANRAANAWAAANREARASYTPRLHCALADLSLNDDARNRSMITT